MTDEPAKTAPPSKVSASPSEPLVSALLRRLDRVPADDSMIKQWEQLEQDQPNIAFFIMACSYRAAPDDPETRAMIANNMLNLYVLLGEARLHDEISRNLGDSMDGYFS